jgi:histidine triad (HIT) family protein
MAECLFCAIANGSIPAKIVHQDDRCVAFHDLNPMAPLHVLVIPREHVDSLAQASDPALTGHLFHVAARIAKEQGHDEGGYRVVANTGESAGQSVRHLHVHLLAGRRLAWPPG